MALWVITGMYLTKYPNATMVDDSGIGDTPYVVYGNVSDNYPLMAPFDVSTVTMQLPTWVNSLPTLRTTPIFPTQNTENTQPSPTTAVPEIQATEIIALMAILLASATTLSRQNNRNKHKKQ